MSYMIETLERQGNQMLQVVIITGPDERWEDIVDSLEGHEQVSPVGCILANPGPRWSTTRRKRKSR